jgi:Lrp/AsnC family leucine-responsive transcriptional regulator
MATGKLTAEESYQLDSIDWKIVAELSQDGRLSNVELARRVGLSSSPCWTRVRRLEKLGVIAGYVARIDWTALGLTETVIVEVSLHEHGGEAVDAFVKALEGLSEVTEAWVMTGHSDFLLKVAVAGTAEFERFLRESLYPIANVAKVESRFTMRKLKQSGPSRL